MTADPAEVLPAVDRDELLAHLFRAHYRRLLRLACLLVDDQGSGEEVVQDAFVKLHRSLHRIEDQAAAPAYLRSIVLNLARSRLRRRLVARRYLPGVPRNAPPADELALLHDDQREVLAALRSLPTRQRECLALRYYLELSEGEIAATLRISTGTVKTHVTRGMAALASKLETLA